MPHIANLRGELNDCSPAGMEFLGQHIVDDLPLFRVAMSSYREVASQKVLLSLSVWDRVEVIHRLDMCVWGEFGPHISARSP